MGLEQVTGACDTGHNPPAAVQVKVNSPTKAVNLEVEGSEVSSHFTPLNQKPQTSRRLPLRWSCLGTRAIQGYLAHTKLLPPEDHRRALGIVLR